MNNYCIFVKLNGMLLTGHLAKPLTSHIPHKLLQLRARQMDRKKLCPTSKRKSCILNDIGVFSLVHVVTLFGKVEFFAKSYLLLKNLVIQEDFIRKISWINLFTSPVIVRHSVAQLIKLFLRQQVANNPLSSAYHET